MYPMSKSPHPLTNLFPIDGGLSLMETNPRYRSFRLVVSMDNEVNFTGHKWSVSMEGESLRLNVEFIDEEYLKLTGSYLIRVDGSVSGSQTWEGDTNTEPKSIDLEEIERIVSNHINPIPDELFNSQVVRKFLAQA